MAHDHQPKDGVRTDGQPSSDSDRFDMEAHREELEYFMSRYEEYRDSELWRIQELCDEQRSMRHWFDVGEIDEETYLFQLQTIGEQIADVLEKLESYARVDLFRRFHGRVSLHEIQAFLGRTW